MHSEALIAAALLIVIFVGITLATIVAFRVGLKIGRWKSGSTDPESIAGARVITTGALSLLAFVLGFTFRLGTDHFDARNQALNNEAMSISTAYHRADLLPEPERTNLRNLLREYIDVRLQGPRAKDINEVIAKLRQLQEAMWSEAISSGKAAAGAPPTAVIQALNDVIDVNSERVLSNMQSRIPFGIWATLFAITIVSVAGVGYFSGLTGTQARSVSALVYALIFAGMIVMIADVDVPRFGHFQESNQPLVDLRGRMTQSHP